MMVGISLNRWRILAAITADTQSAVEPSSLMPTLELTVPIDRERESAHLGAAHWPLMQFVIVETMGRPWTSFSVDQDRGVRELLFHFDDVQAAEAAADAIREVFKIGRPTDAVIVIRPA